MDFSILKQGISTQQAKQEFKANPDYKAWRVGLKIVAIAILIFAGLGLLAAFSESQPAAAVISSLLSLFIGFGILWLVRFSLIKSMKEGIAYKEFAKANNLGYVHNRKSVLPYDQATDVLPQQKGVVFGYGSAPNIVHGISNNLFALYTYSYVTGSGKSSRTHFWTVLVHKLDRKLPHVLFDNKKNNFWKFSNLPSWFSKDQKVSLGAAVDDYFDLYSPEGYDIDTLSYLTPELLELLITEFSKNDVEVVDDVLYVYQGGVHKREAVPALYARITALAAELNQNSRVYSDSRVMRSTEGTHRQAIANEGRRLKKNKLPALFGAIFTFGIIGLQFGVRILQTGWGALFIIIPILAFVVLRYVKKTKSKD